MSDKNYIEEDNNKTLLKILILALSFVLFMILAKYYRSMIMWLVDAMMFLFGVWCIFGYPKQKKFEFDKKKLTEMVTAMVSEVKEIVHSDIHGKWRTYLSTYEFRFRGKVYRVQSKKESEEKPSKGIDTKLLIDPDEPTEIYEVENAGSHIKVMKFVGVGFIVCSLFIFLNNFI